MVPSRPAPPAPRVLPVFFALLALFSLLAVSAAAAESPRIQSRTSPRGGRDLPSSEQLAEIRRVVELVRESRDQLPPSKLAQLALQLRQLRARIDATRATDRDGELEKEDSVSTEATSRVDQVRSLSGGFNNDLRAHTLDAVKSDRGTLFYDDVRKGVIEAPPSKDSGRDEHHNMDASDSYRDGDYYDDSFNNGYHDNNGDVGTHGNGGVSIAVGVSSGLHAFDGKTQPDSVRGDGGKRVIGVGSSFPVPHDVRSYGTPKPGGAGGSHPSISDTFITPPHSVPAHDPSVAGRHVTGTRGGSGAVGFGPPKGVGLSSDAYADSTTTRSFLDYSHQSQGQLFHENYLRSGFQSAVIPPGDPHAATVHIAPAVGPHAETVVFPGAPPHAPPHVVPHVSPHENAIVAPPGSSGVSVHIGFGGHQPVVEYTPPAHVSPEQHRAEERPRSGGKIIFPVSGPHHAEASYVAPPPQVHVTHVEEHVTSSHAAPVHVSFGGQHAEPHVTHVEEHVYEEHREPHSSSHVTEYHEPQSSHVEEYHNSPSYSIKDDYHSSSYSTPHDVSQYGPPQHKPIPVPYIPQHVTHARPVHVTHYKKRPGFFDALLQPFRRIKSLLFGGGGRGHARPVAYESIETPAHNYYEYGAAVAHPKKCRCIDSKSVLGVLVAGVAGAGLVAYIYALTTSNSTGGFARAVDGPDRAAMARLMLQEACSLGADAERMWNGTVWIGDGDDGGEEDEEGGGEDWLQAGKQASKRRRNGLEEANQLSLKSLSSAERTEQKLLEQQLQASVSRSARHLDSSDTPSSHQVVKKAAAGVTGLSSGDAQEESPRAKRSAAGADQAALASSAADFHMFSFDGMDIPMRHSARDPGLLFPLQPRKAVFRPPAPRPFTPDVPDTHSPDGSHSSDSTDAFFNHDLLDSLDIPDASYRPHLFSRRMDLLDDITASSQIDRSDSDLPLSLVESPSPDDALSSTFSNNGSSSAVKATRGLPGGGDLLAAAVSLLPMVDLGPFQPLTRAFQAVPAEERDAGKSARRGNPYRKRMKNMFVGLRQFITKGMPSAMKRTAYDPHCGCIPLTLQNVGLVGAPIFAVVASGLVLTFLIVQNSNQSINGRKRSEDASASAPEQLASALETLLTAEETAPDTSSDATRLRSYYRQIVTPVAAAGHSPQLAALSGALEATSVECSRYYMCEMAMSAASSGEPLDMGVPLLSLPVSWMLTSTQGGEFGQYCSSAVLGGSGSGNCALLYPGCKQV